VLCPTHRSRPVTNGTVADVLVDTDVFIDHLRGAAELKPRRHRVHYSVITRAELFAGNSASDLFAQLLAPFREVDVDRAIAERAGRVRREAGIRLPDALIAATALERDLDLASRNTRDFKRVRGLRLRSLN
jgi:toxin FitB